MYRIGHGSDVHRLSKGRPLVLGGETIESAVGAEGHSDSDALTHALTDAILGALSLGDIGAHFPDTEQRWQNVESFVFLKYAVGLAKQRGYSVLNVDSTVSLERPKLRPYIENIRLGLAKALDIEVDRVSVKAKTGEKVDAVGKGEAIRAEAVVMLVRND